MSWAPDCAYNTLCVCVQAVRTLLASMEEKAAAAEPKEKEPQQQKETDKEVKGEPRSDDVEERIRTEALDGSLQEMLQSEDTTEDREGEWPWNGASFCDVQQI